MSVVRRLSLVGALLLSAALPIPADAVAGELADRAKTAEELIAGGKPVQALAEMEASFNAAWDLAPLGFSEALFVAARPSGFGIYDARVSSVFREGEDMLVYAEPFGFGYGREGELFLIDFKADFQLKTPTGQILHEQKGFADLKMKSRRRNKEFQVFITYNFSGLKPGDYILTTRLHDEHSDKVAGFDLPFTITAATPPSAPAPDVGAPAETGTPPAEPQTPAPQTPAPETRIPDAEAPEAPAPASPTGEAPAPGTPAPAAPASQAPSPDTAPVPQP